MIHAISQIPFKINGNVGDPSDINFDIKGYYKKRTVIKGELTIIEYYRNYVYSSDTYTDLVVKESRVFDRNLLGLVNFRTLIIDWYVEDDTIGLSKEQIKYYSKDEVIQEGMTRRNNMISAAKLVLLNELKLTVGEPTNQQYGFDFLLGVSTQMTYFKEGYIQPLRDAVQDSTKPYFNQDIKDKIITELTF